MAPTAPHQFESKPSDAVRRRLSNVSSAKPNILGFSSLTPMWAGIAGSLLANKAGFEIAISVHDSVYNTDFSSTILPYDAAQSEYREHLCKFLGAGVTLSLLREAPNLCTRLWLELDIVPIVFNIKPYHTDSATRTNIKHRIGSATGSFAPSGAETPTVLVDPSVLGQAQGLLSTGGVQQRLPIPRTIDEQADSAARKALLYFGPGNNPRLSIGPRNQVAVDAAGKIHLIDDLDAYRNSVGEGTWNAVVQLADELREKKVKIGFFSSTPQGGKHALIRFLTLLDVDAACKLTYFLFPTGSGTSRIHHLPCSERQKNNHNILQGVAAPTLRLTQEQKDNFDAWILKNGLRWTAEGGPLAPGGVDVAFIDDPQMPGLIPLIRKVRPEVPIVYRSHIEIRSDLVHKEGSPQEEVWNTPDLFISHPVNKFVPSDVPIEKVCLLGAATDWLDGLNKELDPWDSQYYMGEFRSLTRLALAEYVIQIARFDPSKGIPNVIDSYAKFRELLKTKGKLDEDESPQLLVCGHGAVDDPDASIIYDQVIKLIHSDAYKHLAKDIIVMRIPPSDQLLNALMANSKIALQLSTREGFEVKVSEALHAGKPTIASRTGGIPLQIQHGKSGYLCDVGDNDAVAGHLYELYTDEKLYQATSKFARENVSDEVGTVGNAAAWLYLAVMYSRGEKIKPHGQWINDLLRKETAQVYREGEPKLPRGGLDVLG
ncbi:trehalose synthase [Multifurca ochricompacta]|uniref:Trehalose synthase n=1 Tax=Multifurca ochricompacta TaxID=376703 RepID=A0AAD4LTZ4_9AGAM|nr:trehalose synthase [Multifurca ochricompacta]